MQERCTTCGLELRYCPHGKDIDVLAVIEQHADIRPLTKEIAQGPLTLREIDDAAIAKARDNTTTHKRRPTAGSAEEKS